MTSPADSETARKIIAFGPFRLFAAERRLEREGSPVALGSRAFDILLALVERAPEVVSKRELLANVWPDLTVDEGSLRFHVAALRKALGDGRSGAGYVSNVSGRGYCFVAPVFREVTRPVPAERNRATVVAGLPADLRRMVGRDEAARSIVTELTARRFVTIVGPGGIGKTTLAVSIGHGLAERFAGAVHFVDFGSLQAAALVASVVAAGLGLPVSVDDPVPAILAFLRGKRLLLLLDNCEHLIDTVAALAERIFEEASEAHILATSRESLRVEGEHVHRLLPLGCPPEVPALTAEAALAFPAVRLFVDCARASGAALEVADPDGPILGAICRRLDGIALALELAAGQVEAHGLRGIAALLDNQFSLVWRGRRTALPRHQTLAATLDWSYSLLTEDERTVLRRLAVFAGSFSLEAAQYVASDEELDGPGLVEAVASLVAKSLLAAESGTATLRYRLLDTTRTYARQKLGEDGEEDAAERRHALYIVEVFEKSGEGRELPHAYIIDARTALGWCFSDRGDSDIGVSLVAAAAPVLLGLSLLAECRVWTERALAVLGSADRGTRHEMLLQTSYASSAVYTRGNSEDVQHALTRSLDIAEALGDYRGQIQQLGEMLSNLNKSGDWEPALSYAVRCARVADALGDPAEITIADCILCIGHYHVGNLAETQEYCERVIRNSPVRPYASLARSGFDLRLFALLLLAETLWLKGAADRALTVARQALSEAQVGCHAILATICLHYVADIHLLVGDWATADDLIQQLIAQAEKHMMMPTLAIGRGFRGRLLLRQGGTDEAVALLREGFETLEAYAFRVPQPDLAPELAEGLASIGQPEAGLAVLDTVLARFPVRMPRRPELLRVKGSILASSPRPDYVEAENCLMESLSAARQQGLLAWELRTSLTIAELWRAQGRADEAVNLIGPIYRQFTEGFGTPDLVRARSYLGEPGSSVNSH